MVIEKYEENLSEELKMIFQILEKCNEETVFIPLETIFYALKSNSGSCQ